MKFLKSITLEKIIVRLLLAWGFVSMYLLSSRRKKYDLIDYFHDINFLATIISIAVIFIALNLILQKVKGMKLEKILLFSLAFIYFELSLTARYNMYYYLGVMILMGMLIYYALKNSNEEINIKPCISKITYIVLGAAFVVFVGGLTSLKYLSYNSPGFDFGIFAQMFHNMKTTLLPNTTCELNRLASHFTVHISPIYYLILPVYSIFPSPVTLQISQSVILASGLIPLYLLCKHFKLSNFTTIAIGICYAFYPALASGCFYDIHENAFLTPLVLWLLFFIEKEKLWGILAFSVLIFMVKEDAPVYVAFIAMYMIFGKKQYKKGSIVFVVSVIYFIFVLWLLKKYGVGAKFDRYNNYIFDDSGIIGVIKAVILNPAYVISQSMSQEKFFFMLQILMPLAFLPLLNKNYSKYILVVPFVLVNLMSNYPYQHSIDFQYNFGVTGIFFYLVISNLDGIAPRLQKMLALFCAVSSIFLFSITMPGKLIYLTDYKKVRDRIQSLNTCVEMIPTDAAVSSSAFIVAHLYDHKTLYELPTINKTEYVIIDLGVNTDGVNAADYRNDQYEELYFDKGTVALFKLK